jgi:drug/metabolite transporter (DMT)-like permease
LTLFQAKDPSSVYVLLGLTAALLFGAGAQFSKLLLLHIEPMMMAGLVYLGSGFVLLIVTLFSKLIGRNRREYEAGLTRKELPWLTATMLFGSFLAPVILMYSLPLTAPATAALLLNFEAVSTTIVACLWSRENVDARIFGAIILITLSCILLTYRPEAALGISVGAIGVLLACTFWGIDNNIMQRISSKDPITIIMVKGLTVGTLTILLALGIGNSLPDPELVIAAIAIGTVGFGGMMSVCLLLTIRGLGSSRGASIFSLSPFFGLIFAFLLFAEIPSLLFVPALLLMIAGTYLLISEEHVHEHTHTAEIHEHRYRHDDPHHNHPHGENTPSPDALGYHSHLHEHTEITHSHPHRPDIHHRHRH